MFRKTLFAITLTAAMLATGTAYADWQLNMPQGATELSAETYRLHMLIFWVTVAIGVLVFGAMIYSLIRHRKSVHPTPAKFSHSTKAEIIWTAIPVFILLGIAVPAAETMIRLEDSRKPDMSIVATGYQWKWHYRYQDEGVEFFSNLAMPSVVARPKNAEVDPFSVENYLRDVDRPMVVPVGAKVRLLLTSNDVLHAWWVPELAIKKDAIPGIINETWFQATTVGTYRGQCAELCGKDHGYMPIVVEVVEPEEFVAWVEANDGSAERFASNFVADPATDPATTPATD